jgi:uncharacterized membrane protein HdeD (DUF308 family)
LGEAIVTAQVQTPPLLGLSLAHLAENWWLLLLRGIAAIAFGVLTFFWPGLTLLVLIFLWGIYAIADGILALWAAVANKAAGKIAPRWWLAIVGLAGISAGVLTFVWPGMTALVLLMFIAAWAIISGVFQIWGAIQLRKEIEGEWMLGLSGLLSVAFGVIVIAQPGAGAVAVIWLIGWFAILLGCCYMAFSLRLRKYKRSA